MAAEGKKIINLSGLKKSFGGAAKPEKIIYSTKNTADTTDYLADDNFYDGEGGGEDEGFAAVWDEEEEWYEGDEGEYYEEEEVEVEPQAVNKNFINRLVSGSKTYNTKIAIKQLEAIDSETGKLKPMPEQIDPSTMTETVTRKVATGARAAAKAAPQEITPPEDEEEEEAAPQPPIVRPPPKKIVPTETIVVQPTGRPVNRLNPLMVLRQAAQERDGVEKKVIKKAVVTTPANGAPVRKPTQAVPISPEIVAPKKPTAAPAAPAKAAAKASLASKPAAKKAAAAAAPAATTTASLTESLRSLQSGLHDTTRAASIQFIEQAAIELGVSIVILEAGLGANNGKCVSTIGNGPAEIASAVAKAAPKARTTTAAAPAAEEEDVAMVEEEEPAAPPPPRKSAKERLRRPMSQRLSREAVVDIPEAKATKFTASMKEALMIGRKRRQEASEKGIDLTQYVAGQVEEERAADPFGEERQAKRMKLAKDSMDKMSQMQANALKRALMGLGAGED